MNSALERVRVRMTRLVHTTSDRPAPDPGAGAGPGHPVAPGPCLGDPSSLAADVRTLEQIIADSEQLMRQAWSVAADLNAVRRQCSRCEAIGILAEALGTFQGLLNHTRHNLRAASQAVGDIKAKVSAERR